MHQADAQEAALPFHSEALAQVQRVVISVPGENATVAEKFRDLRWIVAPNSNRNGRAALVKALGIADTEEAQLRNPQQALDQSSEQCRFVLPRRAIGRQQRAAAILCARLLPPSQFRKVIDRRANPRDQLLHLRPSFP